MVGLAASQLPPDTLHAGDRIVYYSLAFVFGDERGYREAVITKVDATPGRDHPIAITTGELIQLTQMVKRTHDSDGNSVNGLMRKLRTFALVSGEFDAQSDRSLFCEKVNSIVTAVISGHGDLGRAIREQIPAAAPESPELVTQRRAAPSHASVAAALAMTKDAVAAEDLNAEDEYEEKALAPISKSVLTDSSRLPSSSRTRSSSTSRIRETTSARLPTHAAARTNASGREDSGKRSTTHEKLASDTGSTPDIEFAGCGDEEPEELSGLSTLALVAADPQNACAMASSSSIAGVTHSASAGSNSSADGSNRRSEGAARQDPPSSSGADLSEGTGLVDVSAVDEYLKTVPTRFERSKIRHQAKKRAGTWHQPRSRKKRHQKKCAVTRSGTNIYHAHSVKAKKMKDLLRLPGMRNKLRAVRGYRPTFVEPTPPALDKVTQVNIYQTYVMEEVPWPDWVKPITQSIIPAGLEFEDIGDGDSCLCQGDCFADICTNAKLAIYCTPDCCRLGAKCSNAPRTHPGLKIYDTHRLGLGVYTTEALYAGEVIAEYCGSLCEYDALYEGQPEEAKKHNSGYTMLLNEKSKRGKFVYVEALKCGSIARFFQHACTPNVEFVEMQNRSSVKVLARMIESVRAGAQIVVHYGDEIWFKCACDLCWIEHDSK